MSDFEASDEDIWLDMGFSKNPYNFRPLRISHEDWELFIGRPKEREQFRIQVAGIDGGIVLVQGPVGVGKTSFVNAMQYYKWKSDGRQGKKKKDSSVASSYLPSFETIELKENAELVDFMLSVLSNCIHSFEKIHGEAASQTDPDLKAGKELVANTVRAGLEGFNISILGSGGGVQKKDVAAQPSRLPLQTIMSVMDRWFDKVVSKYKYRAILVPINNLDVISENGLLSFLNSARDTLLSRHHVWWILIGASDLSSTLETKARRVSEMVTGMPIDLEPMSLSEVHSAIEARIRMFKTGSNKKKEGDAASAPVPQQVVDLLYNLSNGEIRYVFRRLTNIVYQFKLTFPSEKQIPLDVAIKSLKLLAQTELDRLNLSTKEEDLLKAAANLESFRIRDYKQFGFGSAQSFQQVVARSTQRGLLSKVRKSAKEVLYAATGDVNLAYRNSIPFEQKKNAN